MATALQKRLFKLRNDAVKALNKVEDSIDKLDGYKKIRFPFRKKRFTDALGSLSGAQDDLINLLDEMESYLKGKGLM